MRARDEKANDFRIVILQELPNRRDITRRFRHFLVLQPDESIVHPVVDEGRSSRLTEGGFGLSDFVLVVRKLKILPPAVNVEMRSQQLRAHGRAFDVPSGASRTPG